MQTGSEDGCSYVGRQAVERGWGTGSSRGVPFVFDENYTHGGGA